MRISCVGYAPVVSGEEVLQGMVWRSASLSGIVYPLLKTHMRVNGEATPTVKWCDSNVCCEVLFYVYCLEMTAEEV